jgi:hypothetical protein
MAIEVHMTFGKPFVMQIKAVLYEKRVVILIIADVEMTLFYNLPVFICALHPF